MDPVQVSTNIVAVINFVAAITAALLSWLGENWPWFASEKRTPLTKKLIVFGVSILVGAGAIAAGSFVSPGAVSKLEPYTTAFIAFAFAIGGALVNHYGINKIIPAIIKFLQVITAAQGGDG